MLTCLDDRARPYLAPAAYAPPEIPEPQPMSPIAAGTAAAWAIHRGSEPVREAMRTWLTCEAPLEIIDALLAGVLDPLFYRKSFAMAQEAVREQAVKVLEEL
ncbi:hypothetical protein IMZ29_01000 [Achromobacter sp. GG226]|uniref:hypothetical protein n=1 Tax=Verticiella alkaliphila TaxID=2779529 RepID=UPI001C0D1B0D|nr:hypothetical protein [Verticiella sp. GG226]MBU4609181.1 hypothetical protein [Verticiella sp. GG226]